MKLPEEFEKRMHQYFTEHASSEEEQAFWAKFNEEPKHGIRWNRLKVDGSDYSDKLKILDIPVKEVPWCPGGYYTPDISLGKDPYYHAGAYYIQEPSAMLPASVLGTRPGEYILDMCAAPGGKATRIAEDLQGEGILFANEINAERARALLRNLERAGASNVIILNENPKNMVKNFEGFFDRIIIDAPCSGEGMFRRDPFAPKSWERFGPSSCVPVQKEILGYADSMLREGGTIVYSTCTFNEDENENQILGFLNEHTEYSIVHHPELSGVTHLPSGMMRIWPHKTEGEGHFCVCLKKGDGEADPCDERKTTKNPSSTQFGFVKARECFEDFMEGLLDSASYKEYEKKIRTDFVLHKDKVHMMPVSESLLRGLKVVKMGDFPGEIKETAKGRVFTPSQALALELSKEKVKSSRFLSLDREDPRLLRYLRCETVMLEEKESEVLDEGEYLIVAVDDLPLGFAKKQGMTLKNAYPKAWRLV